jgi:hypothetical protein
LKSSQLISRWINRPDFVLFSFAITFFLRLPVLDGFSVGNTQIIEMQQIITIQVSLDDFKRFLFITDIIPAPLSKTIFYPSTNIEPYPGVSW